MADVPALCASLRALAAQVPVSREIAAEAASTLERLAHELVEARAARKVIGPRYDGPRSPEP